MKGWLNSDNVVCVLTTYHIQQIEEGLRSRCFEVEFNASSNMYDYIQRMKQIIQHHKLPILTDDVLYKIAERSKGDWK